MSSNVYCNVCRCMVICGDEMTLLPKNVKLKRREVWCVKCGKAINVKDTFYWIQD